MPDLDLLIGSDQYDDLATKTNAAIDKVNEIKEFLEPLTAAQVPRQVGTTDFEFEGIFVPTLKNGEDAKEKKRIVIPDWNMAVDGTIDVPHGLTSTQWKTLSIIAIAIRNDADDEYYLLWRTSTGGNLAGGVGYYNSTNIGLARATGGFFDDGAFNAISYDRGHIDIEYIP